MTPLDWARRAWARAWRGALRPLARALIRARDPRRLGFFLAQRWDGEGLPVFVVVVPRTLGWLEPCLRLVPADVPLFLVANGVPQRELRWLTDRFPDRPLFSLTVPAGTFARHGTVLDLLVTAVPGDFAILDHDCYVFDRRLFDPVAWQEGEFLAAIDRPGFYTVNSVSGLRFPRTHFLVLRRERLLDLRRRHDVGCEKATRTPCGVRRLLAGIGLGDHNFPPSSMPFYDTLQLAVAVGLAEGWSVRLLPVEEDAIAHIGGTAKARFHPSSTEGSGPQEAR